MKKVLASMFILIILSAFIMAGCLNHNANEVITSLNDIESLFLLDDILSIEQISTQLDELVYTWRIRYLSDDYEIVGYISAPKDYLEVEKQYPVLIYNRGGNGSFGQLESPYASAYSTIGFITFASQYRGVENGTGKDEFGGNDINDVLKLIDIAERCAFVDNKHIFMLGHSRGGLMTYRVLREDARIRAAIIIAGVVDVVDLYNNREQGMKNVLINRIGGTPDELHEEYNKRSAIKWVDDIDTPLLIFHAEDDWRVPISQVDAFVQELEYYNKEYEYVRSKKGGHGYFDIVEFEEFINRFLN